MVQEPSPGNSWLVDIHFLEERNWFSFTHAHFVIKSRIQVNNFLPNFATLFCTSPHAGPSHFIATSGMTMLDIAHGLGLLAVGHAWIAFMGGVAALASLPFLLSVGYRLAT
jgi:hypothetical protein